jgi:hypothetical protein
MATTKEQLEDWLAEVENERIYGTKELKKLKHIVETMPVVEGDMLLLVSNLHFLTGFVSASSHQPEGNPYMDRLRELVDKVTWQAEDIRRRLMGW